MATTRPPLGTIDKAARRAVRELKALARDAGDFDAARYFRGDHKLRFYNTGTKEMRAVARAIHQDHRDWSVDDAMEFAELLLPNPCLEVKMVGIEVVIRYRRHFTPRSCRAGSAGSQTTSPPTGRPRT